MRPPVIRKSASDFHKITAPDAVVAYLAQKGV